MTTTIDNAEQYSGNFYGVYMLCSESTERRYKGKCYIGFTVNPNRRIKQHNRGKDFGGARKTNNKGPWKMIMIVHGFPNNISALQFEWAWQQPRISTRLKNYTDLRCKKPKETYFQYNFRILSRMLLVGPWTRLPLVIRWLEPSYECDFAVDALPPRHMQIVSGRIVIAKSKSTAKTLFTSVSQPTAAVWSPECHLCMQRIEDPQRSRIGCLNSLCKLTCHLICLANHMIASDIRNRGHYIPIIGECPLCEQEFSWMNLLQHKRKMQGILVEEDGTDDFDDDIDDDNISLESLSDNGDENKDDNAYDKNFDILNYNSTEDSSLSTDAIFHEKLSQTNNDEIYEISD